jgi:hypothetical protein
MPRLVQRLLEQGARVVARLREQKHTLSVKRRYYQVTAVAGGQDATDRPASQRGRGQ